MTQSILSAQNARRLYRNGRGVKNVSMEIGPGEIVGLLGPNGCGKTTFMKLIAGLCRPDAGRVAVEGIEVSDHPEKALLHVGALIEAPALYENLSVRANLRALQIYDGRASEARANRALALAGMESYARETCKNLSLGMKQRVGLAIAFMGEARLLVLDEPTNGLDIEGAVRVREAIQNVCRETGAAALISSHIAYEIEKTCARAILMREGEVIAQASMEEIVRNYASLEAYYMARARAGEASA